MGAEQPERAHGTGGENLVAFVCQQALLLGHFGGTTVAASTVVDVSVLVPPLAHPTASSTNSDPFTTLSSSHGPQSGSTTPTSRGNGSPPLPSIPMLVR